MDAQEKMFYTFSEASSYLNITENVLQKWMNRLHIGVRTLPNTKGKFISKRDVLLVEESLKHPDILT